MRQHKPARCRGFTLIEVIVAIAIFSVMVMLAGAALNQGLRQYKGLMEQGLGFWNYARVFWLSKSVNSVSDYYVKTDQDGWAPYFRGQKDTLCYVSLTPFAGRLPVVVWLKTERDPQGKLALNYYERPVYTLGFTELEELFNSGSYRNRQGISILSQVDTLGFSYYGYDDTKDRNTWSDHFEGHKRKKLPQVVRVIYRQGDTTGEILLNLNVNSLRKTKYNARTTKPQ